MLAGSNRAEDAATSSNNTTNEKKKKLSLCQLSIMIFTLTSSGPFGVETAIQSGGVLYTLIGLIIIPIIYAIPQSLMCSELGSMMPSYHGYIIWVYRAFDDIPYIGNFIGFFNSIGDLIAMGSDIPIYTILMLFYFEKLLQTYLGSSFSFTFWSSYLFKLLMIIIGGIFNIFNVSTLGNFHALFAFIILLPFMIGFIYSIPAINIDKQWFHSNDNKAYDDDEQYQWGLFMSTLLWLHTGWDSFGSFTAELNFPKSKIFLSFAMGITLDYLGYTIPIIGALTVSCNYNEDNTCWDDGYLYTAYNTIIPSLGILVVISGFVSNYGCYTAEMAVQARTFWALSQPYVILLKNGKMYIEGYDGKYYDDDMNIITNWNEIEIEIKDDILRRIKIGLFPEWLCGTIWDKTGAPVRAVLLQSVISAILIIFDFEQLLQGTILINGITFILEFSSFIILRYKEPNTERPFKVCCGWFGAYLITTIKLILIAFLMFFIIYDTYWYLYVLIGNIIICLIWYRIYLWRWKVFEKKIENTQLLIDQNIVN